MSSQEGLTLLGYDLEDQILRTYWRVDAVGEATAQWLFRPFVQVFDVAGDHVAVVEGQDVPGSEWRVGDVHVHQMTLPDEAAALRLGQFDGLAQRNMIFLPDYVPLIAITVSEP